MQCRYESLTGIFFTLSCDLECMISASIENARGALAPLSSRFRLSECSAPNLDYIARPAASSGRLIMVKPRMFQHVFGTRSPRRVHYEHRPQEREQLFNVTFRACSLRSHRIVFQPAIPFSLSSCMRYGYSSLSHRK